MMPLLVLENDATPKYVIESHDEVDYCSLSAPRFAY